MSNILIMNENFVDPDFLTGQTQSSEITDAPSTNVQDRIRRTRVWRSEGYWEITSSNKAIVFNEGASNLTANIAEGVYDNDDDFLTAIKTALDAAGLATYTVTRDTTTNKINILSSLTGGATIFSILWTNVGSTAASILGFSTGADDTGASNYTADLLRIHTLEWIRWDLGTSLNPQIFALIGTRNEGVQLTSSAVVTLEGNATDVWSSPSYSQVLTYNENCMALVNTEGLHTSALRYWRLTIYDPANPDGFVQVSNIYLGEVYEPEQGCPQFPLDIEHVDLSTTDISEWGTPFSDVRQMTEEFTLDWFGLTKVEYEELRNFVELYGTSYPFWICMDPNEVFSTNSELWIRYCRFTEPPTHSLVSPNVFEANWSLREEL